MSELARFLLWCFVAVIVSAFSLVGFGFMMVKVGVPDSIAGGVFLLYIVLVVLYITGHPWKN